MKPVSERERQRRQRQSEEDRILREAEVGERTGLSRTTRWRLIHAGKFPASVKLTDGGAVGWLESEIVAWQRARVAERDQRSKEA